MKLSQYFWQTTKEIPNDAEIISHQLMIRSGLIHKSSSGLYNLLPMGLRIVQKIKNVVRQELDKVGCQELLMTMITPSELWKESGRWEKFGPTMLKAKDRQNRDVCLSPTNEETITDIFRKNVKSYKQLPVTLYQINTKFRDEIRPRFGVLRAREFIMKDAYSFHDSESSLNEIYQDIYKAYENIFRRLGLEFITVEADAGAMASSQYQTHEFQVLADNGEDRVIHCKSCGYSANVEKATTKKAAKDISTQANSDAKLVEVETVGKSTIKEVASALNLSADNGLKCLLYEYGNGENYHYAFVFLEGDDVLNELKLMASLEADYVRLVNDHTMERLGLVKGYIGPCHIDQDEFKKRAQTSEASPDLKFIFDKQVKLDKSYFVGANKKNYHLTGYQLQNDKNHKNYSFFDLREGQEKDLCFHCDSEITIKRGIEVGHIFQLGDTYSRSMKASIKNQEGKDLFPYMGCYGIGITRIMAAAIEQCHDDKGIIWPRTMAPFHIHLCTIGKGEEILKESAKVYEILQNEGYEVLWDERKSGPGFKFKDADLLGLPLQVVLGEKNFLKDGTIELKVRKSNEAQMTTLDNLLSDVKKTYESV